MPNRVIREGFLDDEKINALTDEEQMLFIRLTLVVDDFGCWSARPEMVRSRCYPVTDKGMTFVRQALDNLHTAGLISIYEAGGKRYLYIHNFRQRLRKMIPKFPKPPEISDYSPARQTAVRQSTDNRQRNAAPNPESESRILKDSSRPAAQPDKKPRERNQFFDFVAETWGINPDAAAPRIQKLASTFKILLEAEGSPLQEIKRRKLEFENRWPKMASTPEAVSKHWADLKGKPSAAPLPVFKEAKAKTGGEHAEPPIERAEGLASVLSALDIRRQA